MKNIESFDAEEFLKQKDIYNHPIIADRNNQNSYEVAELIAEFANQILKEKHMKVCDRKDNLIVDVISSNCPRRACYTPKISYKNEEIIYVCGRRVLHGCPDKYIKEKTENEN